MKKWIFLFMAVFFLVGFSGTGEASEARSEAQYQSNGEVSFYGVYEKITEPENELPGTEVHPNTGTGTGTLKLPLTNGQKYFPQTGEKAYLTTFLTSLFTIVLATLLYNSNHKKQKNGGITQ